MSFRFLHFPEDVPASPGLADPSPVLRRLQRCVVGAGRRTNTPLPNGIYLAKIVINLRMRFFR